MKKTLRIPKSICHQYIKNVLVLNKNIFLFKFISKQTLNCNLLFSWEIKRFYYYIMAGIMPNSIYNLLQSAMKSCQKKCSNRVSIKFVINSIEVHPTCKHEGD